MLQIVLNDLSVPTENCARDLASARLKLFARALRKVSSITDRFVVNGPHSLAAMNFAANWSLAALRNDPDCVDEGVYLKTIQDRFPYTRTIEDLEGQPHDGIEYQMPGDAEICAGQQSVGLGIAHQFDGLSLSIASHDFWNRPSVVLSRLSLEDDGTVQEQLVSARNAVSEEDVSQHEEALGLLIKPNVSDGAELWHNRHALLPHLRFIPQAQQQIESMLHGDSAFEAIVDRLIGIDAAVGAWRKDNTAHPFYPFHVTGESRTRKILTRFADSEGQLHFFEDHARYTPGKGRIHFLLQTEPERVALIGYIGLKLGSG